jgi:methionine sulfoxide reductase heme-binding subunit
MTTTMLPWIVARGLGIAGYCALVALVGLGMWLRHPWRTKLRHPSPEAMLRVHASLAAATLALVLGHIIALVVDPWAGVGLKGAIVPGAGTYRPPAVALGSLAVYFGLFVGLTAAFAGRLRRIRWLPIHHFASLTLALVWLHGVLAGSDTRVMLPLYVGTGVLMFGLWVTRRLVPRQVTRVEPVENLRPTELVRR